MSVLGLLAFREVVPLDVLRSAEDAIGNYLQTIGGIYAVLLAFVVYVVWGQFLLCNGAVLTVGSVYLLAFEHWWLHAIVTAALAGAIAHILFLIRDLDDAFAGDWQVARTPFEHARKNFERPTHKVDVDAVLPAG